jgi:hypothetical protein
VGLMVAAGRVVGHVPSYPSVQVPQELLRLRTITDTNMITTTNMRR